MEIVHQFTFRTKDEPNLFKVVQNAGLKVKAIQLPGQNNQQITVLISESSTVWHLVNPFLGKENIFHAVETTFSREEVFKADWIRFVNVQEKGYPQPEKTWIENPINYGEVCASCGVYKQAKPYHIANEPKLGRNSFMSLTWTGDTLFAVPEVFRIWNENNITGYDRMDVILHQEQIAAKTISQIYINNTTLPGLVNDGSLASKICPNCGVTKYAYHRFGRMKYQGSSMPKGIDIVRTHEWFGSGHLAYQEIFVSNRLARIIIRNGWKGISMKVVETI